MAFGSRNFDTKEVKREFLSFFAVEDGVWKGLGSLYFTTAAAAAAESPKCSRTICKE